MRRGRRRVLRGGVEPLLGVFGRPSRQLSCGQRALSARHGPHGLRSLFPLPRVARAVCRGVACRGLWRCTSLLLWLRVPPPERSTRTCSGSRCGRGVRHRYLPRSKDGARPGSRISCRGSAARAGDGDPVTASPEGDCGQLPGKRSSATVACPLGEPVTGAAIGDQGQARADGAVLRSSAADVATALAATGRASGGGVPRCFGAVMTAVGERRHPWLGDGSSSGTCGNLCPM
jgi:hypothetical protein